MGAFRNAPVNGLFSPGARANPVKPGQRLPRLEAPRGFASRGALWYDIAVWVINMEYEGYTKLKRMDEPDVLGMGDCMNLQTVEYIHPQWYTREFARERGLTGGDR